MGKIQLNEINAVLEVDGEMVAGKGEDSFSHSVSSYRGYIGVFDGCGGIGSKRYEKAAEHTGAYLASRLAAKIFLEKEIEQQGYLNREQIHEEIQTDLFEKFQNLKAKLETPSGFRMKGDLQKTLPTTAALMSASCREDGLGVKCLWAGDSRGYVLTDSGLAQVTKDDIDDSEDAFSNISGDSRLTNMVNADSPFVLHERMLMFKEPCILFVASDGVFNYMPTPMDFENVLLQTLLRASSLKDWELRLNHLISKYASDDYSFRAMVYGFENFGSIKNYYAARIKDLQTDYIQPMKQARAAYGHDKDVDFWNKYKQSYERYLH